MAQSTIGTLVLEKGVGPRQKRNYGTCKTQNGKSGKSQDYHKGPHISTVVEMWDKMWMLNVHSLGPNTSSTVLQKFLRRRRDWRMSSLETLSCKSNRTPRVNLDNNARMLFGRLPCDHMQRLNWQWVGLLCDVPRYTTFNTGIQKSSQVFHSWALKRGVDSSPLTRRSVPVETRTCLHRSSTLSFARVGGEKKGKIIKLNNEWANFVWEEIYLDHWHYIPCLGSNQKEVQSDASQHLTTPRAYSHKGSLLSCQICGGIRKVSSG